MKKERNTLLNELGRLNSLGVTRNQILHKLESLKNDIVKMKTVDPKDQTNEPEQQEFAVYNCPGCGFTIDATKELPPENLECHRCGKKMVGLTREEFHFKSGKKPKFNTVDNTTKIPEIPEDDAP